MDAPQGPAGNSNQLTGWKEIAVYLGKSVRTVQRWERHAALPVHRVQPLGEVVFAFRSELDAWRSTPIADEQTDASAQADTVGSATAAVAADREEEPKTLVAVSEERQLRRTVSLLILGAILILALVGFSMVRRSDRSAIVVGVTPSEPQVQGQHFKILVHGSMPLATLQRWTRVPNGQEEPMSTPLQTDHTGETQWGFSTDCRTETGTHHLWVEDLVAGDRSPPITLVVLSNPACDEALPDLAARVDRVAPTSVQAGDSINLGFTIWNMGTASAVPTLTRVRLGTQSTRTGIADSALADLPTSGLDVGGSTSQLASVPIPSGTAAGVYYLWIVADNGSATIEPNSFNNFARSEAIVVSTPGGDK
jgi:hypothetical protein